MNVLKLQRVKREGGGGGLEKFQTVSVQEDGEVLSVVRADVEEQGGRLAGAEAERDVLPFQRQVGIDGGRLHTGVPVQLVRLLEGVGD